MMSSTHHKFQYPLDLVNFVNSLPDKVGFHRLGALTAYGKEFVDLLQQANIPHLSNISLRDAKNLIKHSISNHTCLQCKCTILGIRLTNLTPYCSMKCYKISDVANKKISDIKSNLYKSIAWKTAVEKKKTDTCLANHGVAYPMQSPEIFRKHEKASIQSYTHRGVSGLRGYEKYVVDWLMDQFGFVYGKHFLVGTEARSLFEQRIFVNNGHRYPDLYVVPWNTYIEVKSEYTLSKFDNFEDTVEVVESLGSDYICLLVDDSENIHQVSPHSRDLNSIASTYTNFKNIPMLD